MRKLIGLLAMSLLPVMAATAAQGKKVEPVRHIGLYVMPHYQSASDPDGRPNVAVAKAYDAQLASNKREDILAVRDAIKTQPQRITPMTLMVLAIRLFDVGERDESVFWFYVAKDRYFTLAGVLDVRSPMLSGVPVAVRDFATLAGPFINGYAFCDVSKQRDARAKSIAWVEANPYEILFMDQLPGLPGDRHENLARTLAEIKKAVDEEGKELADQANLDQILRARLDEGTDAKFCPGGKNTLEPGPIDPSRPRGRNPFKVVDGKVAYFNLVGQKYPVPEADPKTFRHVGGFYGKDARHVFYGDDLVKGADVASFKYLGRQAGRDAKAVYIGEKRCETCDAATFRVLDDTDRYELTNWYADKDSVFENAQPLPGADPATFQPINTWFAKDRNRVYHSGEPVPFADAASFKLESCGVCEVCGEDKNRCYIDDRPAICGCKGAKRDYMIGSPVEFPAGVQTFITGRFGEAGGKAPGELVGAGFYATRTGPQTLEPFCWDKAGEARAAAFPVTLGKGLYQAKPHPQNKCEFELTQPVLIVGDGGLTEIWIQDPQGKPQWNLQLEPGRRTVKATCRKVERERIREKTIELNLDLEPGAIYKLTTDQVPEKCAVKVTKR